MAWLLISITGYFFNTVAILTDKILLNKMVSHPAVYAFFVSLFSLFAIILVPFGFNFPSLTVFAISMTAGILFTFALLLLYTALQQGEVSRVDPLIGGVSPVFVLIFAWLMIQETLSVTQIAAFFIILAGGYLILIGGGKRGADLGRKVVLLSLASAGLFALSQVLTKWVYIHDSFVSGLVWRSIGNFTGSMILLAIPLYRKEIMVFLKHPKAKTGVLFFTGQFFGGASFVLINYAFSLGSIALVNALAGIQYIFLFFLILPISNKFPQLLEETMTPRAIRQKILSLVIIAAGIFILFA
jgi:drug/metabolite transporter (DMT)-like permease